MSIRRLALAALLAAAAAGSTACSKGKYTFHSAPEHARVYVIPAAQYDAAAVDRRDREYLRQFRLGGYTPKSKMLGPGEYMVVAEHGELKHSGESAFTTERLTVPEEPPEQADVRVQFPARELRDLVTGQRPAQLRSRSTDRLSLGDN
jgi:hypothetical protein